MIYRNFDGKETLEHEWFEAMSNPRSPEIQRALIDMQTPKLKPTKERSMINVWNIALLLAIAVIAFVFGMATGAHAQVTCNTFGNTTNCYGNGFGGGGGWPRVDWSGLNQLGSNLAAQRNTEALINEMRAARGQPPCSIGLIGQWQGMPAC